MDLKINKILQLCYNQPMEKDIEQKYKDFLSTISHELRTPLTSIRGFADTILMSYDKLSDEQKQKFIKIIKDQSDRLIELVENILTVSKMEDASKSKFVFKAVNPYAVLKTAIYLIIQKYPSYNFNIKNNTSDYKIYVDENKLQQIFINILENACKYSPQNFQVDINLYVKNSKYYIEIRDYGIGISADDFDTIFEQFSRIDSPLTRQTEGSGIGLYITKNLVEKMHGKITPIKQEQGTSFLISFDVCEFQTQSQNKIQGAKQC